jgi:hypothetical protein
MTDLESLSKQTISISESPASASAWSGTVVLDFFEIANSLFILLIYFIFLLALIIYTHRKFGSSTTEIFKIFFP